MVTSTDANEELTRLRAELAEARERLERLQGEGAERQAARQRSHELERMEEIDLLLEFGEIDELPAETRMALEQEREQLVRSREQAEQIPMTVASLGERWDKISKLQEDLEQTKRERDQARAELEALRKKVTKEQVDQDKARWVVQESERRLREARAEIVTLKQRLGDGAE